MIDKEQNCCNNEIVVSSHLEGTEQTRINNQNEDHTKAPLFKIYEGKRDHSTKLRFALLIIFT